MVHVAFAPLVNLFMCVVGLSQQVPSVGTLMSKLFFIDYT